jgi:hypothetical protein
MRQLALACAVALTRQPPGRELSIAADFTESAPAEGPILALSGLAAGYVRSTDGRC